MKKIETWMFVGLLAGVLCADAKPDALELTAQAGAANAFEMKGNRARQQLVAETIEKGQPVDVTHKVKYAVSPAKVVTISPTGFVETVGNGDAVITATYPGGLSASVKVKVTGYDVHTPVHFRDEIVPVFTKARCNAGAGCHGKAGTGQNGFRLSLLGFNPDEDHEFLVKESRGRRLSPAAPENSLLLLKSGNIIPHGGGLRLEPASHNWNLIVDWIKEGMKDSNYDDPAVAALEVFPKQRYVTLNASQQLSVTAIYADGRREDVTRTALYEANDKEVAEVDKEGHVTFFEQPGDVSVMIRYQGQVAV